MFNDQTSIYRNQRGTWTDNHPDIIKDDWKRIGEQVAFNAASRANLYNKDGTRKTHKDAKFPAGYNIKRSPRKIMQYNEKKTIQGK